jgi:hypothetical protein
MLAPNLLPKVVLHDGSRLLLGLIGTCSWTIGGRSISPLDRASQAWPSRPPFRERHPYPGHPRPVVASLPQREGLLALRFFAPASLLPYPLFAKPAQPAHPSPQAGVAPLAAGLRRGSYGAFGRLRRDGHDPRPCHREGEGFSRMGLLAGQASFGCGASKTEWVYGLKVALVDPDGVITAFFLAPAASDERPIGEALVASDRHGAYLADKGFTSVEWERLWMEQYGALVAATPNNDSRQGVVEGRSALSLWQAPDHRRDHRPAQGLLLFGAPSCQDVGRTADTPGSKGCGLHLRPTDQRLSRPTAAPPGGPARIAHCT